MHPEFAPVAFIAAFSLILPLPWHWRAGNVATLSIIGWLFVTNVIFAVDAILWADNAIIKATVWCDITTKIIIGANFALPATCLCVAMHLEQVASLRLARTSIADKRRRQFFEAFMCLGLPMIFMALHYIVQGHRFDIVEFYGCRPSTFYSIPAIFITYIPPLLLSSGALLCSGLALRHFMIRRLTFAAHLNTSNSALTTSRYFRLMAMAVIQMIWSIFGTSYVLWFTNMAIPLRPWTNWADVHFNFSRIDQFPAIFFESEPFVARTYQVMFWFLPVSTFLFVGFFSFGKDATDEYKAAYTRIKAALHLSRSTNDKRGFQPFPSPKKLGGQPISSPTLVSSSASLSTAPWSPKAPPTPSSMHKSEFTYDNSDTISEVSHYACYTPYKYKEPKAVGSISDLSTHMALGDTHLPVYSKVIHIKPDDPAPPSPPPFSHVPQTQRALSPRPFTYPSYHNVYDEIQLSSLSNTE